MAVLISRNFFDLSILEFYWNLRRKLSISGNFISSNCQLVLWLTSIIIVDNQLPQRLSGRGPDLESQGHGFKPARAEFEGKRAIHPPGFLTLRWKPKKKKTNFRERNNFDASRKLRLVTAPTVERLELWAFAPKVLCSSPLGATGWAERVRNLLICGVFSLVFAIWVKVQPIWAQPCSMAQLQFPNLPIFT